MDEMKHHLQETPGTTASREVRGLPDIVSELSCRFHGDWWNEMNAIQLLL